MYVAVHSEEDINPMFNSCYTMKVLGHTLAEVQTFFHVLEMENVALGSDLVLPVQEEAVS